ncbi:MAG: hypothetical protein ACI85Q_002853, partial [Salibacteraceae bacterium]
MEEGARGIDFFHFDKQIKSSGSGVLTSSFNLPTPVFQLPSPCTIFGSNNAKWFSNSTTKMGGSIKTCLLLCISLGISIFGFTQSVFNIAFDENGTTNSTPNSLEVGDHYYFVQKNYRNNKVFLEVMKLNQQGQEEKKEVIASHSTLNIFYGFSGSLQYLSSNEFCQLYHIALD